MCGHGLASFSPQPPSSPGLRPPYTLLTCSAEPQKWGDQTVPSDCSLPASHWGQLSPVAGLPGSGSVIFVPPQLPLLVIVELCAGVTVTFICLLLSGSHDTCAFSSAG